MASLYAALPKTAQRHARRASRAAPRAASAPRRRSPPRCGWGCAWSRLRARQRGRAAGASAGHTPRRAPPPASRLDTPFASPLNLFLLSGLLQLRRSILASITGDRDGSGEQAHTPQLLLRRRLHPGIPQLPLRVQQRGLRPEGRDGGSGAWSRGARSAPARRVRRPGAARGRRRSSNSRSARWASICSSAATTCSPFTASAWSIGCASWCSAAPGSTCGSSKGSWRWRSRTKAARSSTSPRGIGRGASGRRRIRRGKRWRTPLVLTAVCVSAECRPIPSSPCGWLSSGLSPRTSSPSDSPGIADPTEAFEAARAYLAVLYGPTGHGGVHAPPGRRDHASRRPGGAGPAAPAARPRRLSPTTTTSRTGCGSASSTGCRS